MPFWILVLFILLAIIIKNLYEYRQASSHLRTQGLSHDNAHKNTILADHVPPSADLRSCMDLSEARRGVRTSKGQDEQDWIDELTD